MHSLFDFMFGIFIRSTRSSISFSTAEQTAINIVNYHKMQRKISFYCKKKMHGAFISADITS